MSAPREGGLDAPTRHPIDWQCEDYFDADKLNKELERVFDICHGCRRCVSLCQAFPTLFDLVDESTTMEIDGVDKADYAKVAEQCYLCDLCFQTKCPYVPPHEWALDFPHLMLQAKAQAFFDHGASIRDRAMTSTDQVGRLATLPVVNKAANALINSRSARGALEKSLKIDREAALPNFTRPTFHQQSKESKPVVDPVAKVALYVTCYGNHHDPKATDDLKTILEHNRIAVEVIRNERCCGMPKLELGDLQAVDRLKRTNIPLLMEWVDKGYQITTPIPSCVLMYRQELPLMYPHDQAVQSVKAAMTDPFELLWSLYKQGKLNKDFKSGLGRIFGQSACHQRVQNIGPRTRDVLSLIPDTKIDWIDRCSGHDGTYAVKAETSKYARKIVRPVARKASASNPDHLTSDCPMAAKHIASAMGDDIEPLHPATLLRMAYGL